MLLEISRPYQHLRTRVKLPERCGGLGDLKSRETVVAMPYLRFEARSHRIANQVESKQRSESYFACVVEASRATLEASTTLSLSQLVPRYIETVQCHHEAPAASA